MKLTKKIETEVLKVYDTWMYSYLHGQVEIYDSFLDDEYHFIGSAKNEEFLNRKDTTQFFADTGDQFAGKTELRNETKTVDQFGELIFITHIFDGWFLNENEWTYYARFRFSNALRKNKDGWKFIYQHFSIPDSKTEDGETIGYDKINEENQELREAIQRRTVELQSKNRELEIETALERVRAKTMAMQHSDELPEAANLLFNEVQRLGIPAWSCGYNILSEDKKSSICIMSSEGELQTPFLLPLTQHKSLRPWYNAILKNEEFFVYWQEGEDLVEHYNFMKSLPDLKATFEQLEKAGLDLPTKQFNHLVRFNEGFLLFITYEEVPKAHDIFQRFGKVFNQTYTRFLDLQKAEAQVREVQIEMSLERVRSRTMGMQKSEELLQAGELLFNEITSLGIESITSGYVIMNKGEIGWNYMPNPSTGKILPKAVGIYHTRTKNMKSILSGWSKQEPLVLLELNEKETIKHQTFVAEESINFPLSAKQLIEVSPPELKLHCFNFQQGYILIVGGTRLSDDQINLMLRFTKVFQQTYTRFLDLQKAEAQAREAQIEAALERVRSRSMAMQNSNELLQAGELLYKELKGLGIQNLTTGYVLFDKNAKIGYSYGVNPADGRIRQHPVEMPHDETPLMKSIVKSWKKQDPLHIIELNEDETIKHQTFIAERSKNFPISTEQLLALSPERLKIHAFNFKQGYLLIVGGKLLTKAEQNLVIRFAKVFQQTYTRFLDLKRAEEQSKEARIETALEKVRSRSMGMQKSEELAEVIKVVFNQLEKLDFNIEHAGFIIDYKIQEDMHIWLADKNLAPTQVTIPYFDSPHWNSFIKAKETGENFFANQHTYEEKNKFYKNLFKLIPEVPEETKDYYFRASGLSISTALMDDIGLYIENFRGEPYSEKENEILVRFAKVFQQTYTRFLDLQKAEVQAKESQIELGLERVRAKAMAMQNSNELSDLVATLLQELTKLDFSLTFCIINIYNESDLSNTVWAANPEEGKAPESYYMKFENYPFHHAMMREWKAQTPKFVYIMEGEEKEIYDDYLYKETEFHRFPKEVQDANRAMDRYVASFVFSPFGGLQTVGDEPLSDESLDILYRFGKVFDQTYTRFQDLQKAEAQTREAQINLAVERVRAKALAMHRSEEIMEVVAKLKDEVMSLDIPHVIAATIFLKEGEDKVRMWDLSSLEKDNDGYEIPFDITFKLKKRDPNLYVKRVWENPENYFLELQQEKDFKRIIAWLRENHKTEVADEVEEFIEATQLKQLHHAVKKLNNGKLVIDLLNPPSDEMETILTKMGAAFDLAYKRFEDLQKAEAQAREAQVEAALERVRSKSMGMQKSDELANLSLELVKQVQTLGMSTWFCAFNIYDNDAEESWEWGSNGENVFPRYKTPREGIFLQYYEAGQNGETLLVNEIGEEDCPSHYDYLCTLPGVGDQLLKMKEEGIPFPTSQIDHVAFFKYGYILFITYEPVPKSHIIFKRFAKVFQQTYTRFLDLKRAEAQAREAQIEAALEKVRSRSLAMQKGEELQEVVTVVGEKLQELGVILDTGGVVICTYFPDSKDVMHWTATFDSSHSSVPFYLPYFDTPIWKETWHSKWETDDDFFEKIYSFEEKNHFFEYAFEHSDYKNLSEEYKKALLEAETHALSFAWQTNSALMIASHNGMLLPAEHKIILKRFSKVFEQAYIRFMDLERSEKQNREAQIELSLERVRAKAMAMHHTDELTDVLCVLFDQFDILGINPVLTHLTLMDEENETFQLRITTSAENRIVADQYIDINAVDAWKQSFANWKNSEPNSVDCIDYDPTILPAVWELLKEVMDALPEGHKIYPEDFPNGLYTTQGHFKFGYIGFNHSRRATVEEKSIVERFAREFGRTYQRFLDLQKAETQAREAQIEASLERVRSKTMAMHSSQDVGNTMVVLFEELETLGIKANRNGIIIMDEKEHGEIWTAKPNINNEIELIAWNLDMTIHDLTKQVYKAWKNKDSGTVYPLTGEDQNAYYKALNKTTDIPVKFNLETLPEKEWGYTFNFNEGFIYLFTNEKMLQEHEQIPERFASVFGQTYRRYQDLLKAEAQLMESRIEAALEKVRSRSLGMHKSEELLEVIEVISIQLLQLNLKFDTVSFGKNSQEGDFKFWLTSSGQPKPILIDVPYLDSKVLKTVIAAQKKRLDFIEDVFTHNETKEWSEHLIKYSDLKYFPEKVKEYILNSPGFARSSFLMQDIALYVGNYQATPYTDKENTIFKRFTQVFAQAYTRFQDLQKAEAQAREAQIEAALEKVRSQSLAMQRPEELVDVVKVIVTKLKELDVILDANGVVLCTYFNDSKNVLHWIVSPDFSFAGSYLLPYFDHPIFNKAWQSKEKGDSYFSEAFTVEEKNTFFQYAFEHSDYKKFPEDFKQWVFKNDKHTLSFAWQKNSAILIPSHTGIVPNEGEKKILKRFSNVFEQAYIRFMDLQKAEAQAREAQIEAALEKVRSRTLAMENSSELAQTSVVVFQQLLELGISPNRLFIGLIENDGDSIDAWATNEDGSKLANHFILKGSANSSIDKMIKGWKQNMKSIVIEMVGNELQDYFRYLSEELNIPFQGGLKQKSRHQYIAYFSGGLIGMASGERQDEHTIELLERFAAVFNLTYTRFKDLKIAEAQALKAEQDLIEIKLAREKAETALSELQSTQKQLVQSEKMASLGELTAGIAHEIQNPLNFVNNFSEVSGELIQEIEEERIKKKEERDEELIGEIFHDIKENLEKINHHGKRADAIVKGMLQHSRSSSGEKQLTDINLLCDEYLRLAYHGLRAKDKSFNATLETNFDANLEKINIVPQEMGRVILNLINNAFYAVTEKKSQMDTDGQNDYDPTVMISTNKTPSGAEIIVKDNGNGMPKSVKDKIFQPFFTTKPTGKGTGLGLSMSYDIIKAHGGEIFVDSREGQGTEFILNLVT